MFRFETQLASCGVTSRSVVAAAVGVCRRGRDADQVRVDGGDDRRRGAARVHRLRGPHRRHVAQDTAVADQAQAADQCSVVSRWSVSGQSLGTQWLVVCHWSVSGQSVVSRWSVSGQSVVRRWSINGQSFVSWWSVAGLVNVWSVVISSGQSVVRIISQWWSVSG